MGASEILVSVPGAQLHKVENSVQTLLVEGDFTVSIVGDVATAAVDLQHLRVEAAVTSPSKQDHVAFPLGKHLPALKAAATIYSFAMENTRAAYFCLILPSGTPSDVLEAVHDVLQDSCAFSTAKQVDAAYEEADKLNGGMEAAALQAANVATLTPGATPAAAASATGVPPAGQTAAAAAAPAQQLGHAQKTTADKIAAGLIAGGSVVASAVGQAAAATASAVQHYAQRQITNGKPNEKPATISPTFKKGLALAGTVASTAAYVTGKLAALVGQASYATALAIARALPGHQKHKPGEVATPEERSALHKVGAAGLVAFVDVYDSLEQAAKVVLSHSAQATAQYITYKYGPEAGEAAQSSVPVAQDMLAATMNFSRLGARAFISKTARKSAKIYLKSTVAGLPLHEQQAGVRVPSMSHTTMRGAEAANPTSSAAPAVASVVGIPGVNRVGSSSYILPNPYPTGSSAAAAAGGQYAAQ